MKIKKILKIAVAAYAVSSVLLSSIYSYTAFAAARTQMVLEYDGTNHIYDSPEITLVINDDIMPADDLKMPPIIIDDRTYVPVRDVFERMGAVVDWKELTSEVFIGYNDSLIILRVNDNKIYIDGEAKTVDVSPKIINNRTMIPVKFASEAMGFSVDWYPDKKIVSLKDQSIINFDPEDSRPNDRPVITDDEGSNNFGADNNDLSGLNNNGMAIDVSKSIITEAAYPQTKITNISLPSINAQNEFRIIASSAISKVNKMLLEDNRLVIDIYNAEIALPKSEYAVSGNSFVSKVRTGQNQVEPEMIARVVFDLNASVNYSVAISDDRKEIIVKLEKNIISNVAFSSDGINDYIKIEGETQPVASVFTLTNPDRIVIDIPLGIIGEKTTIENGMFVTSLRTVQFEESTGRIVADLKRLPEYSVSSSGNITTIKISQPTYKNILYDFSSSTIVIPKTEGNDIDINSIIHTDNYARNKYILSLNGDYSNFFGYGEYSVSDSRIKSVLIQTTNGRTELCINQNKILAYNITEDSSNIYIKPISPKEKYSRIVIIDPGHGGKFTGTTGNGLLEKDVNLSIGLKVLDLLEKDGRVKAYATRLDDVHLHTDLSTELLMRSAIANSSGDLYVSIHCNAFTEVSNGTETYYDTGNDKLALGISKKVADIMQKNLLAALGSKDRKVQTSDFSVLRNTKIPAVLVEVGFISNPEEAAKLATDDYQAKAAKAIFDSIIETFETYVPAR